MMRSKSSIVIVVLVLLLVALVSVVVVLGYQLLYPRLIETGILPSVEAVPTESGDFPLPTLEVLEVAPTETLAATIPLSLAEVGTATPTEEPEPTEGPEANYPGFHTMVNLPDNILLPGAEDDSGVINTLTILPIGGGGSCGGYTSASILAEDSQVLLCSYTEGETVTIELIQPDGTVYRYQATLPYESHNYCFSPGLTMTPGSYIVRVSSEIHPVQTDTFQVQPTNLPEIFTDHHINRFFETCGGVLVEADPFNLYFNNFVPKEEVLVALYFRSQEGAFDLLTTWGGVIDDNGRLVQHIERPEITSVGDYGIAVFGSQRRSIGFVATEQMEASAILNLEAIHGPQPAPPIVSQATITPRPTEATEEPESGEWVPCPGSHPSRLHIGDRAYVSYDPPLANRIRSIPDKNLGTIVGQIEPGGDLKVKDGPECANGWVWWYIRDMATGIFGWTAEGDDENYWLVPLP